MPIQTDDQARQAAAWLRDSGDDPRAQAVEDELRRYTASARQGGVQGQVAQAPVDRGMDENLSPEYRARLAEAKARAEATGDTSGGRDTAWMKNISQRELDQLQRLEQLKAMDPSQAQSVEAQQNAILNRYNPNVEGKTVLEGVGGLIDFSADVGSFMVDKAVRMTTGGYAGLFSVAKQMLWDGKTFHDAMNGVQRPIDWMHGGTVLENPGAKRVLQEDGPLVAAMGAWEDMSQFVGVSAGRTAEILGASPETQVAMATLGYTTVQALPDLVTLGRARSINAANQAGTLSAREARQAALEYQRPHGRVNRLTGEATGEARRGSLTFSPIAWIGRLRQRAQSMRGVPGRGMNMHESVQMLQAERQAAKNAMNKAWKDAEMAGEMKYYTGNVEDWARTYRNALLNTGDDMAIMPNVSRFLDDMERLSTHNPLSRTERPLTSQHGLPQRMAHISELEAMNRRLNHYIRSADSSEFAVLTRMKHDLNNSIDLQFERGLMSGDPNVRAQYLAAREQSRLYYERFNEDQVIARMAHTSADPEEFRRWLLGASNALPPASINSVLEKISKLPNGAKMMEGIRLEISRGLMEPLFKTKPDVDTFVEGVRVFAEKYPNLVDRLDLDVGEIVELANHARVMARHGGEGFWAKIDPSTLAARMAAGHGISKRAAAVSLLANAFKAVIGTAFGRSSRKMWNDYMAETIGTEFQLNKPVFRKGTLPILASIHSVDLQREGIPAEAVRTAQERALAALPEQLREMQDLSEARQSEAGNVPVGNLYNPGDDVPLLQDMAATIQNRGNVPGQTIGSDLMRHENDKALNDWERWGAGVHTTDSIDPSTGQKVPGNPTIGWGTEIHTIDPEIMFTLGWIRDPKDEYAASEVRRKMADGTFRITQEEGTKLMSHRLARQEIKLREDPVFRGMNADQKRAMRNLAYNVRTNGWPSNAAAAMNFGSKPGGPKSRFRKALDEKPPNYREAALELLRGDTPTKPSDYYRVGNGQRALEVASLLSGLSIEELKALAPKR